MGGRTPVTYKVCIPSLIYRCRIYHPNLDNYQRNSNIYYFFFLNSTERSMFDRKRISKPCLRVNFPILPFFWSIYQACNLALLSFSLLKKMEFNFMFRIMNSCPLTQYYTEIDASQKDDPKYYVLDQTQFVFIFLDIVWFCFDPGFRFCVCYLHLYDFVVSSLYLLYVSPRK